MFLYKLPDKTNILGETVGIIINIIIITTNGVHVESESALKCQNIRMKLACSLAEPGRVLMSMKISIIHSDILLHSC